MPQNATVLQSEHAEQYSKVPMTATIKRQFLISASGAYCQQWTGIHGAICICDPVFYEQIYVCQVSLHPASKQA